MKKQDSQCKEHTTLIEQLLNQSSKMKEKYQHLLKDFQKLGHKYKKLSQHISPAILHEVQNPHDVKQIDIMPIVQSTGPYNSHSVRYSHNFDNQVAGNELESILKNGQFKQSRSLNENAFEQTVLDIKPQLRSSRCSSRSSSLTQKFFPLIEGCFIVEKKKCYGDKVKNCLPQMLQFVYPQQLAKTQKQTLQIMMKYTFEHAEIIKFEDDQFNSRKNQIIYGTPYEDLMFAFEDSKWIMKKDIPEIFKLMGTTKKKYLHLLIKPQIIQKDQIESMLQQEKREQNAVTYSTKQGEQHKQYFYETEVIFGFMSPFPLRTFFQDLHRTIQQQLKYSQFQVDENKQQVYNPSTCRKSKYEVVGRIMKRLYDYQYKTNKFPLNLVLNTGITKLQLKIPSVVSYRELEDDFLNQVFAKYDGTRVCKLLHHVLVEKCVLVQAADRRSLNQIFEMIRIMIRPFLWMFAIVYVYSDYFEPFMSSPMPIIIGKVTDDCKEIKPEQSETSMEYSQFCYIKMNKQELDMKDSEPYCKLIKKLKKQWDKCEKDKKQDKATLIHNYVHSLRVFIEKGVLNSEPTDFHIEFIETQMVSYFKDTKDQ